MECALYWKNTTTGSHNETTTDRSIPKGMAPAPVNDRMSTEMGIQIQDGPGSKDGLCSPDQRIDDAPGVGAPLYAYTSAATRH